MGLWHVSGGRIRAARLLPPVALALLLSACWLCVAAQAAGRCGGGPWCDRGQSPGRRATLLLARMSLAEKLQLMGASSRLDAPQLGVEVHGVPRLGIPSLNMTDGPAGLTASRGPATALPIPLALAASFDIELARRYGALVAGESKLRGFDLVFGPTINVVRTPLGGRTFEGYGEDPYLTGAMAAAWIRGLQGRGVIATAKHFVGNDQETGRTTIDETIAARALREIYLPPFEAAVRAGRVGAVMSAYNRVNGTFMGSNRPLLEGVLRGGFGFRGFVISDFLAQGDTAASADAGQSVAMPPRYYDPAFLRRAIDQGQVSGVTIDRLVGRYLRTLFRFGVFDRGAFPRSGAIPAARNAREARTVEERAIVLLRNRHGLLPLRRRRLHSIAVIGASANAYQAPYLLSSAAVHPFLRVRGLAGIRRLAGSLSVRYSDGSDPARATRMARRADVALVFAAPSARSGEAIDRTCLALDCGPASGAQDALIRRVAAANHRTAVVLQSPGPVLMPWARRVRAILEAWQPGEEGGAAIARVLFGLVDPSGKLPVTYPRRRRTVPVPSLGERAAHPEGVLVGYRWYDRRRVRPLFPFGHGLSYTRFRYRRLRVHSHRARVVVSLRLRNVGRRSGAEVVQLYVGLPSRHGVVEPPRSLQGFRRVQLGRDRTRRVSFSLGRRAFSYWDARRRRWRVARGCYRILLGSSSRDIRLRTRVPRNGGRCGRADR